MSSHIGDVTVKKFSTLLVTGKAATFPLLIQQAEAEIVPQYTDILTSQITQIQVPADNQVKLEALGGDTYGGDIYGAATICSDQGVTEMSVTLTGLRNGDLVLLGTATSIGGLEAVDPRLKLGSANLLFPYITRVLGLGEGTVTLTVPIDLAALEQAGYFLGLGGEFYMQSIVFPYGAGTDFSQAEISELDFISVDSCSTYGGPY
jgi:hypothetical protein